VFSPLYEFYRRMVFDEATTDAEEKQLLLPAMLKLLPEQQLQTVPDPYEVRAVCI
jgi:hypothetical protein